MTDQEPCIRCSHPAGHNRLVLDDVTDRVAGGFCRTCELDLFGRSLAAVEFEDDSCALCSRDGFYLLAPWCPGARSEPDGTVTVTGTFLTDGTGPRLCDVHHHAVADPATGGDVVASRHRADGASR